MTYGISPKVQAFVAALGGPGIILLLLGLVLGDDTLRTAGLTALAGGAIGGAAGYRAPAGEVVPGPVGEGSDARLDADVAARLNREG
jgi:hypothetical protein